jgi:hypothetical protein
MTLSTLKTMNVQMDDLRESLKIRLPTPAAKPADKPATDAAAAAKSGDGDGAAQAKPAKPARKTATAKKPAPEPAAGAVDPMQWWGALTKQFTQLATSAMKDTATDAAKNLAGAMVKQSFDAAGQTIKKAAAVPGEIARKAAGGTAPRKRAPAPKG